ncbi:MAG: phosphoglycolate phosphatase [Alcaligenaceae bacterium]|nr:phosphoglycolate phosphatase [Alcaligenaceae bacterium]
MNINNTINTVLFDLDGTLIDSMPELAYCSNQTLLELGREELPLETLSTFVGKGLDRLIMRFLANDIDATTAESTIFKQAKEAFGRHYHANNGVFSQLYPSVTESLATLKNAGFKLGLVTNKAMEFTIPLIEKKGLSDYFDVVIGGDSCEHKKPHPEPVLIALEKLQSTAQTAIFVGDSLNDMKASEAAGVPCLIVPYGYNEGQPISKPLSGDLVDDLAAAVRWIKSKNATKQPD